MVGRCLYILVNGNVTFFPTELRRSAFPPPSFQSTEKALFCFRFVSLFFFSSFFSVFQSPELWVIFAVPRFSSQQGLAELPALLMRAPGERELCRVCSMWAWARTLGLIPKWGHGLKLSGRPRWLLPTWHSGDTKTPPASWPDRDRTFPLVLSLSAHDAGGVFVEWL